MDAGTTSSVVAAAAAIAASGAALVALPFTVRAANAAARQTELQRDVAQQSNQPYVWADVRVNETSGWSLIFMVGNSGTTVATDVVVGIEPPLPISEKASVPTGRAFERLRDGIKSIGPGRVLTWTLGASPDLVGDDHAQPFTITIDGNGPYGPLRTLTYVIDLADYRESLAAPPGSLFQLTNAVKAIEKRM